MFWVALLIKQLSHNGSGLNLEMATALSCSACGYANFIFGALVSFDKIKGKLTFTTDRVFLSIVQ